MRHFIDLSEWRTDELRQLLELAVFLKQEWRSGGNRPVLRGKTLAMIFQKQSLRTRVSFEVGMHQLGGAALMISPQEIGLGKRESTPDIARSLSRFVNGIMARVFEHEQLLSLAEWATVPVINALSGTHHPCQGMADVLTIYERFGRLDGLKVAYIGDGNNVARSLGQACSNFGVHFAIGTPPGYGLREEDADQIATIAATTGGSYAAYHDPFEAVRGADVVYTDVWVSMGQEGESERRIADFQPYQLNSALLAKANRRAVIMHCLPAHRGQEITDEVADSAQSVIFDQAENRLHIQKAILVSLMSSPRG